MPEDLPVNKFPERQEGTPDHPYYHLPELPPEEIARFDRRARLGGDCFFSLAKFYKMQDWRTKHFDELDDTRFPAFPSAKEEAIAIGEITPQTILDQFNQYREKAIVDRQRWLEKDQAEGGKFTEMFERALTAAKDLTLTDVWFWGKWEVLEVQNGREVDSYNEKFPEVVDLIEKALEIQPKGLPGSHSLPSPKPADVIEGQATKR